MLHTWQVWNLAVKRLHDFVSADGICGILFLRSSVWRLSIICHCVCRRGCAHRAVASATAVSVAVTLASRRRASLFTWLEKQATTMSTRTFKGSHSNLLLLSMAVTNYDTVKPSVFVCSLFHDCCDVHSNVLLKGAIHYTILCQHSKLAIYPSVSPRKIKRVQN